MTIQQGIVLVIDEEFRRREHCALCEKVLGESDFLILLPLLPTALRSSRDITFEHVACRRTFAELMDETRL